MAGSAAGAMLGSLTLPVLVAGASTGPADRSPPNLGGAARGMGLSADRADSGLPVASR